MKLLGALVITAMISIPSAFGEGNSILGNWHIKPGVQRAHGPNLGDWGYFVTATGQGPLRSDNLRLLQGLAETVGAYHTGTTPAHRWDGGDPSVSRGWGIFIHEWLPNHVKAVFAGPIDEAKQLHDRVANGSSRGSSASSSAAK